MNYWFPETREILRAFPPQCILPDSYLVFDIETTGFSRQEDLIVEVGWAVVHNRQVVDCGGMILDWSQLYPNDWQWQAWLRQRMETTAYYMAQRGRQYRFSYERLQREGVPPLRGLLDYTNLLYSYIANQRFLAGHGAWKFDRSMIDAHTQRFLDYELPWDAALIYDTGLIEKAAQMNRPPYSHEQLTDWYERIDATFSKAKWNLDTHCAAKYNLADRFHLDMSQMHTAGFDCMLDYAMCETFRQIGEVSRESNVGEETAI